MARPAPSWPTIMPTVTRIPRMQGLPPLTSGFWVIRSKGAAGFSIGRKSKDGRKSRQAERHPLIEYPHWVERALRGRERRTE